MRIAGLLVILAVRHLWRRGSRQRSLDAIGEGRSPAGTTEVDGGRMVDATVEELLRAVQGLLKDESDRAASLNARGAGLTGFIGIILSVAGAAGLALGENAGAGLHDWVRVGVGMVVAVAFIVLVIAVVAVVAKVLLPTPGFTIGTAEVNTYPTWDWIERGRVFVQGHLMKGYVIALERDRARNDAKATWLGRGYKLVCTALVLVALAGAAATLDRYVGGRSERDPAGARTDTSTSR